MRDKGKNEAILLHLRIYEIGVYIFYKIHS